MRVFGIALIVLFCALASAKDAASGEQPVFACTPKGFTLAPDEDGLRLRGKLAAPGAGYSYEITEEEPGPDGSIHAALVLTAPAAAKPSGPGFVDIDHLFSGQGDRLTVTVGIPVQQKVAYAPEAENTSTIECRLAESAP